MELFDRLLGTLSNAVQLRTQDSIVSSSPPPETLAVGLSVEFNDKIQHSFISADHCIGSSWCQQDLYINNDQLSLRERRKIYLLSMSYICTIEQLDCIVLLSKYY